MSVSDSADSTATSGAEQRQSPLEILVRLDDLREHGTDAALLLSLINAWGEAPNRYSQLAEILGLSYQRAVQATRSLEQAGRIELRYTAKKIRLDQISVNTWQVLS